MKKKPKIEKEIERVFIEPLLWIPGQGVSQKKIDDLKGYFPKPNVPLGEAWFMGESREMYDDLNQFGVEGIPDKKLAKYLDESVSGMASFPLMPGWAQWYGYFFPRLVEKDAYFTKLSNGLVLLSLTSAEQPAAKFEREFASILAGWIMRSDFWQEGRYNPPDRKEYQEICSTPWDEPGVYADLAVSLFICWRYLEPEAIRGWLHSVLAIEDIHWRTQTVIWLLKVQPIFLNRSASLQVLAECSFKELWPRSYVWTLLTRFIPELLKWELVPLANVAALREAIIAEFTEAVYFDWVEQMAEQTNRGPELELVMEQFSTAYLVDK